jgi:hypothetical protein
MMELEMDDRGANKRRSWCDPWLEYLLLYPFPFPTKGV